MPPSPQPPIDTSHLLRPPEVRQLADEGGLPPHESKPVGPIIGTIIVVLLLMAGGLYFWGEQLNRENSVQNQIPYIPSGTTTIQVRP